MSEYKRLTTNEPEDNVETMLNYAHSKDKEVFIYDEQGNEVKLTEYIAKHAQEECEVTAEDIMEGCCFWCMDCPLGILIRLPYKRRSCVTVYQSWRTNSKRERW